MSTPPLRESEEKAEQQSIGEVMNALRAIVRALRVESRAVERQLGISLAQLWALRRLGEGPVESLSDLAAAAGTHQSSMSVVVRRLVERDLVLRVRGQDRRRVRFELSDAGRSLLQKAPVTLDLRMVSGALAMAPERRAELASLMRIWLTGAGIDPSALLPLAMEPK